MNWDSHIYVYVIFMKLENDGAPMLKNVLFHWHYLQNTLLLLIEFCGPQILKQLDQYVIFVHIKPLNNWIISSKMLMKIWSCMQLLDSNNKLIEVMSKTWTTTMLIEDNHLPCQNKAIQVKFENKYTYTCMYIHTCIC